MSKDKLIPELRFPEFAKEGEWEKMFLEDILIKNSVKNKNSKYLVVQSVSKIHGFINQDEYFENRRVASQDTLNYYVIKKGYFAYNPSRIDVGSLAYKNDDVTSIISPLYVSFKAKNVKVIDAFLLKWFFSDNFTKQMIFEGGVRNTLNYENLIKIKINLPSIEEQQKVADCLFSLDNLIANHSQKLKLLNDHKKGLMQNLFPQERETVPKKRFPEFKNEGEWVEKTVNEVAEIGRGKSKHRPRDESFLYGGKYPFIQTGDIRKAGLYLTEYSQTYSEEGLKQSKLWNEGTLCITIAANIAETTILKIKACFPDSVIGLVSKKETADVLFIKYLFDGFKNQIQSIAQGAAQDNLNQEKLLQIKFYFPLLPEQQKIASCLSSLDVLINVQTEKVEQLKLYKKGLMQGLFPKMND